MELVGRCGGVVAASCCQFAPTCVAVGPDSTRPPAGRFRPPPSRRVKVPHAASPGLCNWGHLARLPAAADGSACCEAEEIKQLQEKREPGSRGAMASWPHFSKLQQQGAQVLPLGGGGPVNINTFCVEIKAQGSLGTTSRLRQLRAPGG